MDRNVKSQTVGTPTMTLVWLSQEAGLDRATVGHMWITAQAVREDKYVCA